MIVLADTSIWLDHWRSPDPRFVQLLEQNRIVVHPFVIGEIALGAIPSRGEILRRLRRLRPTRVAQSGEVTELIERTPLWGRGIGWVDAHLLASVLLDRIRLWTHDRCLAEIAAELGVAA